MDVLTPIITIIILIMSVVLHELSHGYVADWLGDPTPRLQGRLTANPIRHLDPFGSVVLPIITSLLPGGFTFGWAKPVVWNPYNVKNRRLGEFLISIAGPLANIFLALVFGLILRFYIGSAPTSFIVFCGYVTVINITLAIFNLIPIPPLDGSKIIFSALPTKWSGVRYNFERYSPILVLVVIFFLWQYVEPIIPYVFYLITGQVI